MATTSGIWNQPTPSNSLSGTHSPAASDATSSGDGSTISGNDFLTLLVTEMQNQDPTANTDPNAYVNQLVQVNSLEQLININQTLTTSLGSVSQPTSGLQPGPLGSAPDAPIAAPASATTASASSTNAATLGAITNRATKATAGNLAVPDPTPAAQRVSQALSHRSHLG